MRFAAGVLSTLVTGVLVVSGMILVPYLRLTDPAEELTLSSLEPGSERTLVLLAADDRPFARRGGCVASPVTLREVPPSFIDALLSMEDRRFYDHFGLDPIGIARAAWENQQAGHIVQGGSTITQQLVKYSLLTSHRTMERKTKEAWLALALELRLNKKEILERYVSSAYFGEGCYGLRAAAKHYFGTPVAELSLPQSAYLVALLKSPSALLANQGAAEQRAQRVLDAMVANGKLTPEQRARIVPARPNSQSQAEIGSYYADWIASTLQVPRTGDYSPLPVHTSFEPQLQVLAEQAVDSVLDREGKRRGADQAAMVVMRTDGRVLAMVGGKDYRASQFNRAVQAKRQPGSAFKLFVYLAALRGGLKPDSTVFDEPIAVGNYKPENFGHRYRGSVTARHAFASSLNVVAVRLSEAVGRTPVIDAAHDLGIGTPMKAEPSVALGAFEVTLLQLTSAYAGVAAGAYPVKPWAITSFSETGGNAVPPDGAGKWRLDEQNDLLALLSATVERGTGRRARLSIPAYGKTGTSQDFRDAWFLGFAGNLVVGVWVGNDNFSSMKHVTGGNLPAEIWAKFMREAIKDDGDFQNELPQVAAFPAKEREDAGEVQLAAGVVGGNKPRAASKSRSANTGPVTIRLTTAPKEKRIQFGFPSEKSRRVEGRGLPRLYGGFARGMFE
jgi:penicillin-binding protein 1A